MVPSLRIAAVLFVLVGGSLRAEPDEKMIVAPNGHTRANAWTEISLPANVIPAQPAAAPVLVDIMDPWGQIVFTGGTRGSTISFFTRAWADGPYTLRFAGGEEQKFRVNTEYFDSIRARSGLLVRMIDARRNADGLAPEEWRGASALLQRIITLHLWREPKQTVEQHLAFCEQRIGLRTAAGTVRLLGSGAANVPGYTGPYRPLARERTMMFMPPNAVFDFASCAPRKLERWGCSAGQIEHVFISHSHADHFDAPAIAAFARRRQQEGLSKFTVHAGKAACGLLRKHLIETNATDLLIVDELSPGSETAAGELRVKAVRATHQADSSPLCYIARWKGATVYYGTDTGYPCADTYAALASEKFDAFVHEITAASADDICPHTDLGDLQLLVGKLRAAGAIGTWTRVVSMHQSPEGPQILPDYGHFQQSIGFECGYDGMPIPIAFRADER